MRADSIQTRRSRCHCGQVRLAVCRPIDVRDPVELVLIRAHARFDDAQRNRDAVDHRASHRQIQRAEIGVPRRIPAHKTDGRPLSMATDPACFAVLAISMFALKAAG